MFNLGSNTIVYKQGMIISVKIVTKVNYVTNLTVCPDLAIAS